jgi:hypothetical protein
LFKSWPPGIEWGYNRGKLILYVRVYIGKNQSTIKPEKLIFTWKLPDVVQIQVCSNDDPRGLGGATIRETISSSQKSSNLH